MQITKSVLQKLIREEYVKAVFEANGEKITDRQAALIAEGLDEGIFGSLVKAAKKGISAGGEAFKSAREEDAARASEEQATKNEKAVEKTEEDLDKLLARIQQKTKDMLKSNGYKSDDDNDIAVLGVDTFRSVVGKILSTSNLRGKKRGSGRDASMGKFMPRSA